MNFSFVSVNKTVLGFLVVSGTFLLWRFLADIFINNKFPLSNSGDGDLDGSLYNINSNNGNRNVNQRLQKVSSCPKVEVCDEIARPDLARMAASEFNIPTCVHEDKFTVVLLTHGEDRVKLALQVLQNLSTMKKIHKIILLWNNQGLEPPNITASINFDMPLVIVKLPENKLRQRFLPRDEIETAGVFSTDDDLIIQEKDMNAAFEVWKKHAYGIVGFKDNRRTQTPAYSPNNKYTYVMRPPSSYSMILTGIAFLHKEYLRMFTEKLPKEIGDYIDKDFNCEDIAMNMMISNHTNCAAALYTKETTAIKHIASQAKPGLGSTKKHSTGRSTCIGLFAAKFSKFPLKQSTCVY